MFNIGGGELIVIMLIALIVLGPKRLPDAARQIGKAMGDLRRLSTGFQNEVRSALDTADDPNRVAARRNVLAKEEPPAGPPAPPIRCAPSRSSPVPASNPRPNGDRPPSRTPSAAPSAQAQAAAKKRPPRKKARRQERHAGRRRPSKAAAKPRAPSHQDLMSTERRPRWSSTTAACRSWSTSRSSATGIIKIVIALVVGMVDRVRRSTTRSSTSCIEPYEDIANTERQRPRRGPAAPGRPARGLRGPHEAGALRRASPSPCR